MWKAKKKKRNIVYFIKTGYINLFMLAAHNNDRMLLTLSGATIYSEFGNFNMKIFNVKF